VTAAGLTKALSGLFGVVAPPTLPLFSRLDRPHPTLEWGIPRLDNLRLEC
jgi:hypothetical protein